MELTIALPLALAAIINLLPVAGVLGADRLRALYGVDASEPQLAILLRHRALLFGIVGALLAAAVFRPELRIAAIAAGLTSMLGFIAIARLEGGAHDALARVVAVDWLGVAALVVVIVQLALARR